MAAEVALQWAPESTFASVAASTGLPDESGLSLIGVEADSVSVELTELVAERGESTRRSTAEGDDAVGESGGVQIFRGSITITKEVEMPGAAASSAGYNVPALLADAGFLATVLNDEGAPDAQTDLVAAATSGTQWEPTTIGNLKEGMLVGFLQNGKARSTRVTGVTGSDVTASPALPATPSGTGRMMRQLYANKGWSTDTVYIQYDGRGDGTAGDGVRYKLFGCKLEDVEYTADELGRVMGVYTLKAAYIEIDNSNFNIAAGACSCDDNFVNATAFDGGSRISSTFCGKGGTLATPAKSGIVDPFYAGRWRFKMTTPLSAIEGTNRNSIGQCGWRVGSPTVEVDIPMCETSTALDSDRQNRARRMLVLDAGTASGAGLGFSIHLAGAQLRAPAQVHERGDDGHIQSLMFKSGSYCSDTTTNAADGVNAWLTIGWWL